MYAFHEHPLTLAQAHLITTWFAFSYVASLYISKNARLSFSKSAPVPKFEGVERAREEHERWRDDPAVIKARCLAVSISTMLSCLSLAVLLQYVTPREESLFSTLDTTARRLGFYPFSASTLSLLVTPVLYLGPLYAMYLQQTLPGQRLWSVDGDLKPLFTSWISIRNYWVAPFTEEVVFRACVLATYHLARHAGAPKWPLVFLTPLSFGAAHLHHAWDTYNRLGRSSFALKRAVLQTIFQLAYTSLFGFHCAFLFLRTSSLLPPLASHIWCNLMGLPQLGWELQRFPKNRLRLIFVYVLGVAGYIYAMQYWTRTSGSLYWEGESAAAIAACSDCKGPRSRGPPSWRNPL